jgi:hypothetical protein
MPCVDARSTAACVCPFRACCCQRHAPQEVPQALRGAPADVFGARVAALQAAGLDAAGVQAVVGASAAFLTAKGAPHEQLAFLRDTLGFSALQVRGVRGCAARAAHACMHGCSTGGAAPCKLPPDGRAHMRACTRSTTTAAGAPAGAGLPRAAV